MINKIAAIKPNYNYTVDISLTNGEQIIFDIKPYLKHSGFKKLNKLSFFMQVKFTEDKLYWDDMHDFSLYCMDI